MRGVGAVRSLAHAAVRCAAGAMARSPGPSNGALPFGVIEVDEGDGGHRRSRRARLRAPDRVRARQRHAAPAAHLELPRRDHPGRRRRRALPPVLRRPRARPGRVRSDAPAGGDRDRPLRRRARAADLLARRAPRRARRSRIRARSAPTAIRAATVRSRRVSRARCCRRPRSGCRCCCRAPPASSATPRSTHERCWRSSTRPSPTSTRCSPRARQSQPALPPRFGAARD